VIKFERKLANMITSFYSKLLDINIPNGRFFTESPSTFSYIHFLVTIYGFQHMKPKVVKNVTETPA
jgi:hypothetical protein